MTMRRSHIVKSFSSAMHSKSDVAYLERLEETLRQAFPEENNIRLDQSITSLFTTSDYFPLPHPRFQYIFLGSSFPTTQAMGTCK